MTVKAVGFYVSACVCAGLLIILGLFPRIEARVLENSRHVASSQLELAAENLNQRVKRFTPLPQLIAQQSSLRDLLQDAENSGLVPFVNEQLRLHALSIGASDIYLMDRTGTTIASSNYRDETSFMGRNFSYRPYFQQSLAGGVSQFHALGVTSNERGFFFAAPVLSGTEVAGVLAIKITVDEIDTAWADLEYETLVADPNGVVFMSSRSDWRYRTLAPINEAQMSRILQSRQFPADLMVPLGGDLDIEGRDHVQLAVNDGDDSDVYFAQSEPIALRGWHMVALTPATAIRTQALIALIYWCLSISVLVLLTYLLWQRRRQQQEVQRMQAAERDMLEHRVKERTVELNDLNVQLVEKIEEQHITETELRRTQKDLIQAGKLASLGQMSAALSHEINQPLAAIRSYAGNAVGFLDKDHVPRARENIVYISDMVERISRISKHLTNFARRSGDTLGPVSVTGVIEEAIAMVTPKLRETGAQIAFTPPTPDCEIIGGHLRLQQVMINLLSNGIDAVDPKNAALVQVDVVAQADAVVILVRDNGPGLPLDVGEQVFDPFFTTKEAGQGLGLGLSISYNIIEDFGGKISAANHTQGGAEFRLDLRRAVPTAKAAE